MLYYHYDDLKEINDSIIDYYRPLHSYPCIPSTIIIMGLHPSRAHGTDEVIDDSQHHKYQTDYDQ